MPDRTHDIQNVPVGTPIAVHTMHRNSDAIERCPMRVELMQNLPCVLSAATVPAATVPAGTLRDSLAPAGCSQSR